jgi:hypothetical protein
MPKKKKSKTTGMMCPVTGEKCDTPIVCGGFGCIREKSQALTAKPGTTGTLKPGTTKAGY